MKKVLFIIIVVLLLGVIAFGGYQIYQGMHAYEVVEEYYETAAQYVVVVSEAPSATPEPSQQPVDSAEEIMSAKEEAPVETPEPVETAPIAIDFEALWQHAPDAIGWLYSLDGSINLPVVQGTDNQYYLKRLPDGSYSSGGSLFLDYLNDKNFLDETSFIYGHNMKNGTMLQPLLEYKKQSHYDAYPIMYLLTPEQDFKLELFAGVLTDLESDVYTFSFDTPEIKQQFIDSLIARSTFVPAVTPTVEDRLLCLSTCAYDFENARYVVFGKLTELG